MQYRDMEYIEETEAGQNFIRLVKPEDAGRLVEIYAPYVKQTAVTFEYEVPSVAEFRKRIESILKKYPYLVAEQAKFYRLAYSYLRSREDALDAVQTAVCRALEHQNSLRDPGAVKTWFTRILMNACQDTLRQRGRVVPFPEEGPELGQEDPEPADDTLARRVNALPAEVGTVIKLRFYEEMTLKEIGEVTGQNISTVKSRLYAGLRKLRVAMEGVEI